MVRSRFYRPRVWPSVTVLFGAIPAVITMHTVVLVAVVALFVGLGGNRYEASQFMMDFSASPTGFLVLLVVTQVTFAALAYIPARLSPVPFAERLGLVRPRIPALVYPLLLAGTVFVVHLGELLRRLVYEEPSSGLMAIARIFIEAPIGMQLALVAGTSLLPGICEELLCRGYVQRRLLRRWPPLLAVSLTSIVFAAMHLDPQHILSVIPTAFWIGYVAWRSDSTWPGIACHIFINALAHSLLIGSSHASSDWTEISFGGPVLALTVPGFVAAVFFLERSSRRRAAANSDEE